MYFNNECFVSTLVGIETAVNGQANAQPQQQQQQQQQAPQPPQQPSSTSSSSSSPPSNTNSNGLNDATPVDDLANTTPVPMELEPSESNDPGHINTNEPSTTTSQPQVDLETELREFLEADNNELASNDDVGIEEMLLD